MASLLGAPIPPLTHDDLSTHASPQVKRLLTSIKIQGSNFSGIKPFTELLERVFVRVRAENPTLLAATGCGSILSVRLAHGSKKTTSNHAWGCAIDLMFTDERGVLCRNARGSGEVQKGALLMYEFFRREGDATGEYLFWGAGFRGAGGNMTHQDGMHFEASKELLRKWKAEGRI